MKPNPLAHPSHQWKEDRAQTTCKVCGAYRHLSSGMMPCPTVEQLPPRESSGDCWRLVIADMEARRLHGIEKYGVPVQPGNGRDPLIDAYQEALDLCVYLRQAIAERDGGP